jgi:hypothetical protein
MLFDLTHWPVGPIVGNRRVICGYDVTVRLLPIRESYDLGLETVTLVQSLKKTSADVLSILGDPAVLPFIEKLCDLTDFPQEGFEDDLTAQIPVAMTALSVNLAGFFDSERMTLEQSRHKAVRKAMKRDEHEDAGKIGPDVKRYWFLYRPVMAEMCSYDAMLLDNRYSFFDIHRMHELLDVKQFTEIVANDTEGA